MTLALVTIFSALSTPRIKILTTTTTTTVIANISNAISENQEPRNLYGRDGKFRATTEKRQFSVQLLMFRWCHQIDLPKSKLNTELYVLCCNLHWPPKMHQITQICTVFSKNPGWHPRIPVTGEAAWPLPDPSPSARSPSHVLQSFRGRWWKRIFSK